MSNLCLDCKFTDICRIYDFLCKNHYIVEADITKCNHRKTYREGVEEFVQDSQKTPNPVQTPVREYQNFKDLSNQAKTSKKRKPVVRLLKEETTETEALVTCKTCEGTTYASDILPCTKCGKETCSGCRTEIVETGQKLCDNCWSEE